ncbi:uncharacterized protein J4E88_003525 [Alternaria novae-zelandiae]|uniref:uncharacterized protein n=1 Tax=Alternaria novae-zelandiae TaxID=430562 RepID=UPI0020C3228E|nr:uncharacterized protein J4E88_003525 [Alternaria novae-zelandiae]KAI4687932.1 hypothetical protein J4E88_003525 [Alternaria novae-zelandiae]
MSTTLDQQKEAAYTLLSGMLTSVLQKEWKITNRHSAQSSALLDILLLPKPAPIPTLTPIAPTPIKLQKQSIFRLGNRTFDLGPEHDSSASSSDDDNDVAPIRNARQLKSEMRRVDAIQRRAKRRAERGRRRIEMHLGKVEGVVEFETLQTTKSGAETPVRMVKELEDYNSPARSSPLSSAPMSPRSASFSPVSSEPNQEVAEYDGVDSPMSEPVQVPGRLQGYSCKPCDFTTRYVSSWTRHFQGQPHLNQVARSRPRKEPTMKMVKKAVDKRPQRYCSDCDRTYLMSSWGCHIRGRMHLDNVVRDKRAPPVQGKKTSQQYARGLEKFCEVCDYRTSTYSHWIRHLKCQKHLANMAKAKDDAEDIHLHAPTPESVLLSVEEEEQKEEEEEEYEDDGFGEEGYEYGHYCDDCEVTFAGANWARHLTSAGHVFNVIKNSPGDEDMTSDDEEEDEEEEEESMADYDSATDGESIIYDDATDEDSASPSPSPSSSPSAEEDEAVFNEGITFSHDGTPVADLASPPSLTSSPTSPASLLSPPPFSPASAEFTSGVNFYCETCRVTILSADPWEIDEHIADHAYAACEKEEVVGMDWLSQLREAAGWVKEVEVEVDDMEGVEEVKQGGMECEYNGVGVVY